ncbi:MAG: hypothetical protein H0X66_09140 [Verrucomicrobia bacterium]|nr:hypothetical protein [Verrucomicrobiota bacterium]
MKEPGDSELRELTWRTGLTSAEKARISELLAAQPDLAEEARLSQLLNTLPDAPVPSNFTARVMQAVQQDDLQRFRDRRERPAWRVGFGWVSRLAMAGLVLAAGIFSFQKHQSNQRIELAQSVANFSNVGALPSEWLLNFDTIQHLGSASPVDDELLAALK